MEKNMGVRRCVQDGGDIRDAQNPPGPPLEKGENFGACKSRRKAVRLKAVRRKGVEAEG